MAHSNRIELVKEALAQYETGAITFVDFASKIHSMLNVGDLEQLRQQLQAPAYLNHKHRPGWLLFRLFHLGSWFFLASLLVARIGLSTSIADLKVLHIVAFAILAITWKWLPSVKDK